MPISLIKKNQLDANITDLVGQYGSGYFLPLSVSGELTGFIGTALSNMSGVLTIDGLQGILQLSGTSGISVSVDNDRNSILISYTGVDTANFYTNDNPSGFITGVDLAAYALNANTGSFVTTAQTGAFYAASNPSGYITGVNLSAYALNANTGSFVTTAQTGAFYAATNPSGFITGVDLAAYALNANTGSFVTTAQTGAFYAASNPSGFITGVNLSAYALNSSVNNILNDNTYVRTTGSQAVTGAKFFDVAHFNNLYVDGKAYIRDVDLVLEDYVLNPKTGSFVNTVQTGAFYAATNPSGFITSGQTGAFYAATNPKNYISGNSTITSIVNLSLAQYNALTPVNSILYIIT